MRRALCKAISFLAHFLPLSILLTFFSAIAIQSALTYICSTWLHCDSHYAPERHIGTPCVLIVLAYSWRRCPLKLKHGGCRAFHACYCFYFVSFSIPRPRTSKFFRTQAAKTRQQVGMDPTGTPNEYNLSLRHYDAP